MKNVFNNDPFYIVYTATKNLYPKEIEKVSGIYWYPNLEDEGNKVYGITDFLNDNKVVIYIDPQLSVENAVEILAHELAHVVAGVENEHNKKWEEVFENIHKEYEKIYFDMEI